MRALWLMIASAKWFYTALMITMMNMNCNEFEQAPSTFLQIVAKESQYEALAQRLIEFLYSPNLTITMVMA